MKPTNLEERFYSLLTIFIVVVFLLVPLLMVTLRAFGVVDFE